MVRNIACLLFTLFYIVPSWADNFQNFLWIPQSGMIPVTPPVINVYDDGNAQASIDIPIFSQWRNASSVCMGSWQGETDGLYTYWFQISNQWERHASGLRYRIVPQNENGWGPINGQEIHELPNYSTKTQQRDRRQSMSRCWQTGEIASFVPFYKPPAISAHVDIDRGTAIPGSYQLQLPYWLAYEENSGRGSFGADFPNYPAKLLREQPDFYIQQSVEVHSKCSFDTTSITLDHGTMTPAEARGHITRPYNLQINCVSPVSLHVSLRGNTPIAGKTANFTQCGEAGSCELRFNQTDFDKIFSVNNSTTLSIDSTFHPKSGPAVAGAFSGSAVLSILVD